MADTPTPRLKLRNQTLASNVNVWGDPYLNNNYTAIDYSFSALPFAVGTATATTLTVTNYGTANQTQPIAIVLSGTGTQTCTFTMPLVSYYKKVVNQASGPVVLIGATGTGVTVPAGATYDVVADGTNWSNATPPLDKWPAPTSAMNFNSQRLTSVADGTANTDAATVGQIGTSSLYVGTASQYAVSGTSFLSGTTTQESAKSWAISTRVDLEGTYKSARAYAIDGSAYAGSAATSATSAAASAASAAALAGSLSRFYLGTLTGTNNYTGTFSGTGATLAANTELDFYVPNANTTGATISFNGLGTATVLSASGVALGSGQFATGVLWRTVYDGTSHRLTPNAVEAAQTTATNTWERSQAGVVRTFTWSSNNILDFGTAQHWFGTITSNGTIGRPTNVSAGMAGSIQFKMDTTGTRTVAFDTTFWKFSGSSSPTNTKTPSATDVLFWQTQASGTAATANLTLGVGP